MANASAYDGQTLRVRGYISPVFSSTPDPHYSFLASKPGEDGTLLCTMGGQAGVIFKSGIVAGAEKLNRKGDLEGRSVVFTGQFHNEVYGYAGFGSLVVEWPAYFTDVRIEQVLLSRCTWPSERD